MSALERWEYDPTEIGSAYGRYYVGIMADELPLNVHVMMTDINGEAVPFEAIGRLISAAPDLLAVARMCIDRNPAWGIVRCRASAAIAKAEGRAV